MDYFDILLAKKLEDDRDPKVEGLSVSANGRYHEDGVVYDPVIVNVPETPLSKLTVTQNGTYTAPTGTGYDEVDVDVPLPENAYLLKEIEDVEIASFNDGSDLPMPKLEVAIEPVQDLHGYDAPWVGGAGKNKCNVTLTTGGRYEVDSQGKIKCVQTIESATSLVIGTVYLESGEKYILSGGVKTDYRLFISVDGVPYASSGSDSDSFTPSTSGSYNVNLVQGVSAQVGDIASPMIRKSTESATFAPYSNICPISGFTEANITVADDVDNPTVSNTYTIDLDGTRYGGKVDLVSGVLTLTHGYIASYNSETLPSTWISDRDVYTEGTTPTVGAEVVYKLANPQTYQLTPTQVNSLLQQNNVWADCGDILELSYFSKEE